MIDKKIKISDIAEKAGVSLATVSRVINNKGYVKESTFNQVVNAAQTLGYKMPVFPALPEKENRLLLFCCPSIGNYFYNEVIEGAKSSAQRLGYQFLIYEGHINRSSLPTILEIIRQAKILGIVTVNHVEKDVLLMLEEEVPVIQCCEYNESLDRSYVSIDDVKASCEVIEYLYSLGKRRIALINGPSQYKYASHRFKGYMMGLEKVGIPYDKQLVVNLSDVNSRLAVPAARQLINSDHRPDAIFAVSDIFACAALKAAHLSDYRVPEDISVVGFDNLDITSLAIPSITTINQPKFQMGFSACELLTERIQNPAAPIKQVILDTEMVVRESTSI